VLKRAFMIDYTELKFEKEVGKGAFGVVSSGEWRGAKVAISNCVLFLDY
jgi:predicted Ser/Thr protein kinase